MAHRIIKPLLVIFSTNWITMMAASVTTVSAMAILGFLILGLIGSVDSPYIAMMALLLLPGIFVFGLILIPIGLYWERRRRALGKSGPLSQRYPVIDLNNMRTRRLFLGVGFLTALNILIISIASFEGVAYMDSVEFCGQVCHTVMEPEYQAYIGSPHSRVRCVECHIGPGAPWFVRSKLSGMGQLIAVTLDTYSRPIPTPVHNLRPSRDTCEQCHWPGKFTGDRLKIVDRFSTDENNTAERTALLLHIGGSEGKKGIHSWHISPERETYYFASDERRLVIPWVQVHEDGRIIDYYADGFDPEQADPGTLRKMDCIDCHNRPTHIYELPDTALDRALASGRIDRSIPFIRKVGEEILREVGDSLGPAEEVTRQLEEFYRLNYPGLTESNGKRMEAAITEITAIYRKNVFPKMNLSWADYPNNIGHGDFGPNPFPGCFRCHDGMHTGTDDSMIEMDCDTCHTLLEVETLDDLGISPDA